MFENVSARFDWRTWFKMNEKASIKEWFVQKVKPRKLKQMIKIERD